MYSLVILFVWVRLCVLTTVESRAKIWLVKYILTHWWLRLLSVISGGSLVVESLFIVAPLSVEVLCWSLFCNVELCVLSSFEIILLKKKGLVSDVL